MSDAALSTDCFTEDGVYRNFPSPVVQGRPTVKTMIEGFSSARSTEILG